MRCLFVIFPFLFAILAGCTQLRPPAAVSSAADQLVPRPQAAAALPALPRTNGIVRLAWDAGNPPQTVVNQTTGQSYDVAAAATVTLGTQLAGVAQTYVVTNIAGASNPVTTTPSADTNRLAFESYIYRCVWSGAAGTLQRSTDLVLWNDVMPFASGQTLLITNDGFRGFYRVRLN